MEQISQQILDEIKQRRLSPRPHWQFQLLNGLWWLSAVIVIISGGLSLSLVLNSLSANDWSWAEYQGGWLSLALSSLPLIWLLAGLALIFLVDYNFQHTKKAYRLKKIWAFLIIVVLSILLALVVEQAGWAEEIDETLSPRLPVFFMAPTGRDDFWHRPVDGLLMGVVVEANDDFVILRDGSGKAWQVAVDDDTIMPPLGSETGSRIKIMATSGPEGFVARIIKPCLPAKRGCPNERKFLAPRINIQKGPTMMINN